MEFRICQKMLLTRWTRFCVSMALFLPLVSIQEAFSVEASEAQKQQDPGPVQKNMLDDFRAEMEIGRNMAGRLLAFYGHFEDKQLVNYLNQVGTYVAKAGDYPDRRYMVAVLDSDSVNAFACPGGYILLTKGMLKHANNEAELAAVLGHEAAHVGLQHMFNTLRKISSEEAKKLERQAQERKQTDEYAVSRLRPEPEETQVGTALAKVLMSANGTGLSLIQAAKAGMNMILEKGLDQTLEYEADKEGVKYAVRAGYEPRALDHFLNRLAKQKAESTKKSASTMDKTHPSIADRRKAIADQLNKMNASQITGAVLQTRYEGFKARLSKRTKKEHSL
jgi:predicted Zn-dependent protease